MRHVARVAGGRFQQRDFAKQKDNPPKRSAQRKQWRPREAGDIAGALGSVGRRGCVAGTEARLSARPGLLCLPSFLASKFLSILPDVALWCACFSCFSLCCLPGSFSAAPTCGGLVQRFITSRPTYSGPYTDIQMDHDRKPENPSSDHASHKAS